MVVILYGYSIMVVNLLWCLFHYGGYSIMVVILL